MAVIEITDSDFAAQAENSALPVLLDFYADWCGPCRMLAPTIEELAREWEGKWRVLRADVDRAPELARRFGILSVPTLVLLRDGQERDRLVGGQSREQIAAAMEAVAAQ